MATCGIPNREADGMCKFKFLWDNKIWCLCKDKKLVGKLKCIESVKQKKIADLRWKMTRLKSK